MGGKTSTSTNQVTVPPEVLAQYGQVNQQAQATAATPFQPYSGEFVAPVNSTQQAGIAGTSAAANQAQPYYGAATGQLLGAQGAATPYYGMATSAVMGAGDAAAPLQSSAASGLSSALSNASPYNAAATGLTAASATPVSAQQIGQYLSPYLNTVLGSTGALLNQNNQQQMSGELGNIINQGAFGGDRGGIAAANLEQQQNLANANIYSGIANQGYTTALGAAQQQQQTGLAGAAQLAAIGNQQYTQGTGTAEAQAALGNQEFGQGITSAQALQGLGSGLYTMGANTSSALAGLGSGVQAASLQGAQAQLAAGQVAQQTQQAQDTAEYNQFLQQQSYPFQVDQFLANIAEGTGSLSGSTTTSTTPGGLFSDRRLKEDIRVVGFTFDKQPIYTFRYKGDDTTHMGLMAQDVEKKHPGAVGVAGGYKTVDYDKATEDASERGHFAFGGSPQNTVMLPGLSAADYAGILQAQNQMYAPFSQTGGLYGGQAGSAVRGGMSYVPQANVPVSHLAVAPPAQRGPSPLEQANTIAGLAAKSAPAINWAQKQISPGGLVTASANDDAANDDIDMDLAQTVSSGQRRGGFIQRRGLSGARYADGGMPYTDQVGMGLDIPDDPNNRQLLTAQNARGGGGGSSTLGQLGQLAGLGANMATAAPAIGAAASGIGSSIASILPFLALARGGLVGRHGYDDGGAPLDPTVDLDSDDTPNGPSLLQAYIRSSANKPIARQPLGADVLADDNTDLLASAPAPVPPAGNVPLGAKDPASTRTLTPADMASWSSGQTAIAPILPQSGLASAAPSNVVSLARRARAAPSDTWSAGPPVGLGDAQTVGPSPVSVNPPATVQPATGLAPADLAPVDTSGLSTATVPSQGGPLNGVASTVGGALGRLVGGAEGLTGGYLDKIAHGDVPSIVSLLAGLGAAGAAQTKYPLIALSQGLGAGANAYMQAKGQQATIAQTGAETGLLGAQTGTQQAAALATRTSAWRATHPPPVPGAQLVAGSDSKTGLSFPGPDGTPSHWELSAEYLGSSTPPVGTGAPTTSNTSSTPALPTYAPSAQTDVKMQAMGYTPGAMGAVNRAKIFATEPQMAALDAPSMTAFQEAVGNQNDADAYHRQLLQLGESLNALSDSGFAGVGSNFNDRMNLLNIYRTYAGMLTATPDPAVTSELSNAQIIDKIKGLAGPQIAHSDQQRSAMIANSLSNILPGGPLQKDASFDILAPMLVGNQRQLDLNQYGNNYISKYGTAAGLIPAFRSDTGDTYDREQKALQGFMKGPALMPTIKHLTSSNPAESQAAATLLDKTYGLGFHRYLTGGQ